MSRNLAQVLLGEEHPVKLAVDLEASSTGELSEEIRALGLATLTGLVKKARDLGCLDDEPMPGIATAVYRKAANGPAYLEALQSTAGVRLAVVSQEEEARLGFQTAVAKVEAMDGRMPSTMVVWDSGGGSFQIVRDRTDTTGGGEKANTYLGNFAVAFATRVCVEDIQGRDFAGGASANPATLDHAEALIARLRAVLPTPLPVWAADTATVYAIGNTNSIFYLGRDVLKSTTYTTAMVKEALLKVVGQGDDTLGPAWCSLPRSDPPSLVVPKLCLLYTVMSELKIKEVQFVSAIGSW